MVFDEITTSLDLDSYITKHLKADLCGSKSVFVWINILLRLVEKYGNIDLHGDECMIFDEDGFAFFDISILGSHTYETYQGAFKVNCLLNPLEIMKADKLYRELLGGSPLEAHSDARNLAMALSQLRYRVVLAPPFWANLELNGGVVKDPNVIMHIFDKALEAQMKYLEKKKEDYFKLENRLSKDIIENKIQKPEVTEEAQDDQQGEE